MIYIDTGPFLARFVVQDQYHEQALQRWDKIESSQEHCVTSNFVLDELFTLMARRTNYAYAAQRARYILTSKAFTILRPTYEDEMEAIDLFEKYADQEVGFTDCISFFLIRRYKIRKVFSFDDHFKLLHVPLLH